jgi:hypothetical protein
MSEQGYIHMLGLDLAQDKFQWSISVSEIIGRKAAIRKAYLRTTPHLTMIHHVNANTCETLRITIACICVQVLGQGEKWIIPTTNAKLE